MHIGCYSAGIIVVISVYSFMLDSLQLNVKAFRHDPLEGDAERRALLTKLMQHKFSKRLRINMGRKIKLT
jgi:hypothetical protein